MKRFRFPLEVALDYRRLQAEREEARLQECQRELRYWEFQLQQLARTRDEASRELHTQAVGGFLPLRIHDAYAQHHRKQTQKFAAQAEQCREKVAQQEIRVNEARRQHRLLEKLKEKAQQEWQAAVDREQEALAAEAYLAQWNR